MIKIIDNELIGQKVGPKENLISSDEFGSKLNPVTIKNKKKLITVLTLYKLRCKIRTTHDRTVWRA